MVEKIKKPNQFYEMVAMAETIPTAGDGLVAGAGGVLELNFRAIAAETRHEIHCQFFTVK